MTCKSCIQKWIEYYLNKGFSQKQAEKLSKSLVKRIEKRMKKEGLDYVPLYLLEKAGEGIHLLWRKPTRHVRLRSFLYKWCFTTNWRATLFWSFIKQTIIWVGKSFNPDYTRSCVEKGTCECELIETYCKITEDLCNCACPSPFPHSHQVGNFCDASIVSCGLPAQDCPCSCVQCSGHCSYDCDVGYVWNGVACVPKARAGLHPSKPLAVICSE